MNESVDYMYYARQLQAKAIFLSAEESINNEIGGNSNDFRILNGLLTSLPILLDSLVRASGLNREKFFERAAQAIKITAKRIP